MHTMRIIYYLLFPAMIVLKLRESEDNVSCYNNNHRRVNKETIVCRSHHERIVSRENRVSSSAGQPHPDTPLGCPRDGVRTEADADPDPHIIVRTRISGEDQLVLHVFYHFPVDDRRLAIRRLP